MDSIRSVTSGVGSQHQEIPNLGKARCGAHRNESMETTSPQRDRRGTTILLQSNNGSKAINADCSARPTGTRTQPPAGPAPAKFIREGKAGCQLEPGIVPGIHKSSIALLIGFLCFSLWFQAPVSVNMRDGFIFLLVK